MHFVSENEIMVFGGWQHGVTSKAIDLLDLNANEFSSWSKEGLPVSLQLPDMITKPILKLSDSVIAVQGRKYIHLVNTKTHEVGHLDNSGEDRAE